MGRGKRYTADYKEMIVDLYKSGMTIAELRTISDWVKELREIKVSDDEVLNLKDIVVLKKEIARIKEENEILKKAMAIFATKN